jgi:hypothetical protein
MMDRMGKIKVLSKKAASQERLLACREKLINGENNP